MQPKRYVLAVPMPEARARFLAAPWTAEYLDGAEKETLRVTQHPTFAECLCLASCTNRTMLAAAVREWVKAVSTELHVAVFYTLGSVTGEGTIGGPVSKH